MKAGIVMRLISGALQDMEPDAEKRWSWEYEPDRVGLLDFLNSAVRAIVLQRPDIMSVTEVFRLEPGMRQALPCKKRHGCKHDATILIELIRNMGADGCPGRAILPVDNDILMAWACSMTESPVVENYAYDRMTNAKYYMVYPAVPVCGDVFVEGTFGIEPCEITGPEQEICLPDSYEQAIVHHALADIFAGDSETSNIQKASWHMQMYASVMGIKFSVDRYWPKAKSSDAPGGAA